MKILYIQYTGHFADAYRNLFIHDQKENYYGQKYSVRIVLEQARKGHEVLVLCLHSANHNQLLEKNLVSIGLDQERVSYQKVERLILSFQPDVVILRLPDARLLRLLRKHKIDTFPVFADSFEISINPKALIQRLFLSYELRKPQIEWVANHQINAGLSLKSLGVKEEKILIYDWEHEDTPECWEKKIPEDLETKTLRVFFAGALIKEKGVFDLIESAIHIKRNGRDVKIQIAGKGDNTAIADHVARLGLSTEIELLGLVGHDQVLELMNKSDVVVVPSHHKYPEGLPMTIMESLMVHTPIVVSDHPMFVGRVGKYDCVKFFPEKDSRELAQKILDISHKIEAYRELTQRTTQEWYNLCLDSKWGDMINQWLEPETRRKLISGSLKVCLEERKLK